MQIAPYRRRRIKTGEFRKSDNNKIAADLVGAYVSNNTVPIAEFTALLKSTLAILNGSAPTEAEPVTSPTEKPLAKVSVKKSITPDFLICLDDGKRFKSLKRHLSQLGMSPDEYRAKWNLPADYPMVAPNYSASRSALSKAAGFGKKKPELKVKPKPTKGRKSGVRETAGTAAAE
jgi:predicted transcriptional regulator